MGVQPAKVWPHCSQWHTSAPLAYNYQAMGFTDRDYQRGDYYDRQPGFYLGGQRTLTTNLVIVMFVIYAVKFATRGALYLGGQLRDSGWFTKLFSLDGDALRHPWKAFELLTYGF